LTRVDFPVFALVLLAALTHAVWNSWLKKSSPDFVGLGAIATGWLIIGIAGAFYVGLPAPSHWPYLLVTTVVHTIYAALLVSAYRRGELSLTYPVARGSAPVIVALAAPLLLNDYIADTDLAAVALIVAGILVIGLAGGGADLHNRHAIVLSLATGVAIATYTLIDAAGARSGPSPHTYTAWLFVLSAIAQMMVTGLVHRGRTLVLLKPRLARGFTVGVLSAIAYAVVLWAMTVAPAALVAAVRETSVLFAALLGWGMLGERITRLRWVGVILALIGLVAARL
jgi:drug/metabolite transporter (DMT)-like permease